MKNMKVTIVTVCLNASATIEQCLASVAHQSYVPLEHVVIDGASNDGTLDILDRYRDRIDYMVSEPDRGLYHAMNKGVHAATGDFIYFLNSDDCFCDENVVADMVAAVERAPTLDLVYGDVLLQRGGQLERQRQVPVLTRENLCRWGFCHQALFARRELLLCSGGFSEYYKIVADMDWLARCLSIGANVQHIGRDIAKCSMDGISGTTRWRDEKKHYLRSNYTKWELFRWRKLPGLLGRKKTW